MAHYFLSVALVDLLAAAGDLDEADGAKGRDRGRGVVVVTSSCASMHNATNLDMMSYATTKAATDHLVALLAAKFARWYVRVVGINPGCKFSALWLWEWWFGADRIAVLPTNMNPMGSGSSADIFGDLVEKVPAKRPGRLDDMAGVVLFLVSQAGAYVDGKSIVIDGGRTLFANGQTWV
jgi:NAD(P)-dependent dehydrogenase (short-subunit alcohol dehydrogenase family)